MKRKKPSNYTNFLIYYNKRKISERLNNIEKGQFYQDMGFRSKALLYFNKGRIEIE